ncbi:hypothetical protein Droror1_Dr00006181, partial [Drosera rotundifolia]
ISGRVDDVFWQFWWLRISWLPATCEQRGWGYGVVSRCRSLDLSCSVLKR